MEVELGLGRVDCFFGFVEAGVGAGGKWRRGRRGGGAGWSEAGLRCVKGRIGGS